MNKTDEIIKAIYKFSKFPSLEITEVVDKFPSKNSLEIHHMVTFKLGNIRQASLLS